MGEQLSLPANQTKRSVYQPRVRGAEDLAAFGLVLLVAVVWLVLQLPVQVPDTGSPQSANHAGIVKPGMTLGQVFVPDRDGLDSVSVILSIKKYGGQEEIVFQVKDGPDGEVLRTVRRPLSQLKKGDIWRFHAGSREERWETFQFEPIPDSAGQKLYFAFEGSAVPAENEAKVLMFFNNEYDRGEAYVNGEAANAHVVFRTYATRPLSDLLSVMGENLALRRPGIFANPATFVVLGGFYLSLVVLLLPLAFRAARRG